ncbi:hypothetical protein [Nocardioides perillae]|uniref:DUF222 domain-containing protein n=1 Tax=Nocardioides perillae TaxID=1119534 RepID=A0A7Y9RTD8_9ACTN|nr:hypothetical protein [Nocardioides perillae]NYG56271.1 hypothetical protein [Nocardioides perillae]
MVSDPDRGLPLDERGASSTLALASALLRARREVEAEELRVVAHWADLHSTDPADEREPGARVVLGGERLRWFGGEGTPGVRELATYELALAREEGVQATRSLLADTLDLRHRLPATWAVVQCCELPVWVARKVAAMSRVLPLACCGVVDRAVARAVGQAPRKVLELAEAKVVQADPEGHAARAEVERLRRYATFTRRDAAGMRTLIARMHAGEAAAVDATITRVAEILEAQARAAHDHPLGAGSGPVAPVPTRDQLRAEAVAWLARPADLLVLLLEHADDAPPDDLPPEPTDEPTERSGLLAVPARLAEALRSRDLTSLRPRAVVFLHLHQDAVERRAGVARVEGLGPVALDDLAGLLGQHRVSVQPVLDLADRVSTAAYEFPEALRQRLHLLFDGDAFPHAATCPGPGSSRVDHDHVVPWHDTGPPEPSRPSDQQTSVGNGQPLTRGAHRAKTHLPYVCEPLDLGVVRWTSPHGLVRVVDHRGTHVECGVERRLRWCLAQHDAA